MTEEQKFIFDLKGRFAFQSGPHAWLQKQEYHPHR